MAARTSSGVRLHIVTGKGGTGKTTVAAAMAMALASGGHRVLLVEVEDRQGISQTFDVPPLATEEIRIAGAAGGGEVWGLSVDAKAALIEYLQIFYKLGRAGGVLERFGAVDFATTIAPGVRDVLLIGKVYEANRRRAAGHHSRHDTTPAYDAIVLDAPPTGRVVRFLSVNEEVADLAKMGPIRSQADSITEMLTSPQTAVHVVTLLEEMPVQETVDAVAELRAARLPIGDVIINQVREPLLRAARAGLGGEGHDQPAQGPGRPRGGRAAGHRRPRRGAARRGARPRAPGGPGDRAARAAGPARAADVPAADQPGRCRLVDRPRVRRPARRARLDRRARPPDEHAGHPTSPAAGRRRPPGRPAHRHRRVLWLRRGRQDHDGRGARTARGGAGAQGRRPHHRPRPAARPVDGPHRARQHPTAGARTSTRRPAARSTR